MSTEIDTSYLQRLTEEFKKSKAALDSLEKRHNEMKKELTEAVTTHGVADNNGHIWLEVGDFKLKRERRVSRSFDTERATEWAKENGYWDDVKEVIEVLSEDKVLGLAWTNNDLKDTVQSFYTEKEVWAFKV